MNVLSPCCTGSNETRMNLLRNWKLIIHLLLGTKRFGVNNRWREGFDSIFTRSMFGFGYGIIIRPWDWNGFYKVIRLRISIAGLVHSQKMETTNFNKTRCADCDKELDESPNLPVDRRLPCPSCGSTKRNQSVSIYGTLEMHSSLTAKGRHKDKRRPFIEIFSGADFSRRLRKWMQKLRLIDRDRDIYEEEVTDPSTGKVIHKTKENLREHTGHGSAKKSDS